MNLTLTAVEDPDELNAMRPLLEQASVATRASYSEADLPEEALVRFLERAPGCDETLFLVARDESSAPVAVAASGPFEDPLTGERWPMLVLLYVEPALRHRGVARALVEELRRRLARRDQDVLLARAAHNDDVLISMGERLGLVRTFEVMSSE